MMWTKRNILAFYTVGIIALVVVGHLVLSTLTLPRQATSNTAVSTRSALNYPSNNSPSATPSPTPSTTVPAAQSISDTTLNWAGYETTGDTYSGITGAWTVPEASGSGNTTADATWIGIGGVNTNDLIQVGTQNVVNPNGQVTSSAFYELLPDTSQTLTSVNVNPGDQITAAISEAASGEWTITLTDTTTGSTYSATVNYDSSQSSAEWIEEDPSDGEAEIPLDNFGVATFSTGSVAVNGTSESLAASGAQALTMVNASGQALTSTSALGSNGSSFTITRTAASSGLSISQFNTDPGSWRRHGSSIDPLSNPFSFSF